MCPSPVVCFVLTGSLSGGSVDSEKRVGASIMGMMIARRSRRRLGLNHLPQVAIWITEVKPLDARARAIQVILHFVDLDALCFEVVVCRFKI
jgi:hypothetical protein